MTITTMDGLVTAMGQGQTFSPYWPSATNAAGGFINLSRPAAGAWGQMAIPTVVGSGGEIPTNATVGAVPFVNPGGAEKNYIPKLAMMGAQTGILHVYDRLWAGSGFVGNSVAVQTVTGPGSLTRPDANGVGAEIWLESYTAIGTAQAITIQYTDQSGNTAHNTVSESTIASFPVNRMQRLRLQSGDTGVRKIESATLAVSTGTAGNFGVVIMRKVCEIPLQAVNVSTVLDFADLGLPLIYNSACLFFVHQATTTSTGVVMGTMGLIQG